MVLEEYLRWMVVLDGAGGRWRWIATLSVGFRASFIEGFSGYAWLNGNRRLFPRGSLSSLAKLLAFSVTACVTYSYIIVSSYSHISILS